MDTSINQADNTQVIVNDDLIFMSRRQLFKIGALTLDSDSGANELNVQILKSLGCDVPDRATHAFHIKDGPIFFFQSHMVSPGRGEVVNIHVASSNYGIKIHQVVGAKNDFCALYHESDDREETIPGELYYLKNKSYP